MSTYIHGFSFLLDKNVVNFDQVRVKKHYPQKLSAFSPAVKPVKWGNRSLFDKSMKLGRMTHL